MGAQSSQLLHESESASTWIKDTVTGSHRFKVDDYSFDKGMGVGNFITSSTFFVGGYECYIKYYPDGASPTMNASQVTFALDLKREGKEAKARVTFSLLDPSGYPRLKETRGCTFGKTISPQHVFSVKKELLETSSCLKNDSFAIMFTVTVVTQCRVESVKLKPAAIPSSDLNQHIGYLLETGDGADVTFTIRGETFNAHKCVLAARSPVFRAQFFGPMKVKHGDSIIVDDIEPAVFRGFLHFIYSDSVSELDEEVMVMYQHLLVAADRYEVKRLKSICENKLSQNIDVKNIAINLTLAEQHSCPQLKASCFKFVSSPKILAAIMDTDGYEHLTRTCPYILKELVENTSNDK
ncbi:hypothetical protein LUZ60_002881 [Juncus effusus]|nr:hypothetical protein LUZ60_002881 [Juncus effusus]